VTRFTHKHATTSLCPKSEKRPAATPRCTREGTGGHGGLKSAGLPTIASPPRAGCDRGGRPTRPWALWLAGLAQATSPADHRADEHWPSLRCDENFLLAVRASMGFASTNRGILPARNGPNLSFPSAPGVVSGCIRFEDGADHRQA